MSYEAVRNYHYDRDAPAAYLARIVERFPDVRYAYLVAGEGAMTREEEDRARGARARREEEDRARGARARAESGTEIEEEPADLFLAVVAERFGDPRLTSDAHAYLAILDAWDRLATAGLYPQRPPEPVEDAEEAEQNLAAIERALSPYTPDGPRWEGHQKHHAIAVHIGRALAAGLEGLPLRPDDLPDDILRDYVAGVCQALHRLAAHHRRRSAGGPQPPDQGD